MKKAIGLALAVLVAATVAATAEGSRRAAAAPVAIGCNSTMKIGFATPLTGGAGFLGNEQLSWAKDAVKTLAPRLGVKIQLVTGDTPVEQGSGIATTVAQKFIADKKVVAVLGPSTSGAVAASSDAYAAAGLAHVSPSATRTTLTQRVDGKKEATAAFFRVVPGDYLQGPTDANFMIKNLKVSKVVIMDFQEPYSVGVARSEQRRVGKE